MVDQQQIHNSAGTDLIVSFGMRSPQTTQPARLATESRYTLGRMSGAVLIMLIAAATPAFADATAFIGSTATPANRQLKGFAVGIGLLVLGFEFEYARTSETPAEAAPSLTTGMGNVLLQTPVPVAGMQFYLTSGGGVYRERLGTREVTHFGMNAGGGAKISLVGPIQARLDYRVFRLRGEPLHTVVQRIYAGLNFGF
jgi:hypothetical protein